MTPDRVRTTEGKLNWPDLTNWKCGSIRFDADAIALVQPSGNQESTTRVAGMRTCREPIHATIAEKMPDQYDRQTDMIGRHA